MKWCLPLLLALLLAGCDSFSEDALDVLLPHSESAAGYQVVVLGSEPGVALAVNDAGMIAGYLRRNDRFVAVRWTVDASGTAGSPHPLGNLTGFAAVYDMQRPTAINAHGHVVGYASRMGGRALAFVADVGDIRPLPIFPNQTNHTWAYHISDEGVVVGAIEYALRADDGSITGFETRGAVWLAASDAEPTLLPTLPGHTRSGAVHVSASGVITGYSRSESSPADIVRWHLGSDGSLSGPEPVPGGASMGLGGANGIGDVIGFADGSAVFLRDGVRQALAPLAGHTELFAGALADPGPGGLVRAAGTSRSSRTSRAVVWTAGGGALVDLGLPSQNYSSSQGTGVNAAGWVVGVSDRKSGGQFPTLWMPADGGEGPSEPSGPVAAFTYSCGSSDTCQFTDTSQTAGSPSWHWEFGGGSTSAAQHPSHTFAVGTHAVALTVTDATGSDTAHATVTCSLHRNGRVRCS